MSTINQVVTSKLCTGCGTCSGVCPNEAIRMRKFDSEGLYLPEIEEEKCNSCGICLNVCPGRYMDFEELNCHVFGEQPKDKALGNYQACYIGHSNETSIRYESASGGMASQILIFALERGIIDGALVVRMRKDKPLETEAFIAKTREEVLEAAGSKYCPAATNEALKLILKQNGKFAIVGLPCHIHGIRKAEKIFKELQRKIVLHIGLMCTHTVNFKGTEFLLEKMRVTRDQVLEISYRGSGWPGAMTVKLRNSSSFSIPYAGDWNAYWSIFSSFFFTPVRCMACPDQTNELSDISLGDAWLPELKNETLGKSIIITRTKAGLDLLRAMSSAGVICLNAIDSERVMEAQSLSLKSKKRDFGARLRILKFVGREIPQIKPKPNSASSVASLARTLMLYLNIWLSSNKFFVRLLTHVPFSFFRLYFGIYKFLSFF